MYSNLLNFSYFHRTACRALVGFSLLAPSLVWASSNPLFDGGLSGCSGETENFRAMNPCCYKNYKCIDTSARTDGMAVARPIEAWFNKKLIRIDVNYEAVQWIHKLRKADVSKNETDESRLAHLPARAMVRELAFRPLKAPKSVPSSHCYGAPLGNIDSYGTVDVLSVDRLVLPTYRSDNEGLGVIVVSEISLTGKKSKQSYLLTREPKTLSMTANIAAETDASGNLIPESVQLESITCAGTDIRGVDINADNGEPIEAKSIYFTNLASLTNTSTGGSGLGGLIRDHKDNLYYIILPYSGSVKVDEDIHIFRVPRMTAGVSQILVNPNIRTQNDLFAFVQMDDQNYLSIFADSHTINHAHMSLNDISSGSGRGGAGVITVRVKDYYPGLLTSWIRPL